MGKARRKGLALCGIVCAAVMVLSGTIVAIAVGPLNSINSTSQNKSSPPAASVPEQPRQSLINFQVVGANDLGMHCGDFDHRNVSILPPFNTLHAQVIKKGPTPQILDQTQAQGLSAISSTVQSAMG